eukprot:2096740-Prymnesium_polylepis.1
MVQEAVLDQLSGGFLLSEPTLDTGLHSVPSIVRYERGRPISAAMAAERLAASHSAAALQQQLPPPRAVPRSSSAHLLLTRPPPRSMLLANDLHYRNTSPRNHPGGRTRSPGSSPPDTSRLMRTTSTRAKQIRAVEAETAARKEREIVPRKAQPPPVYGRPATASASVRSKGKRVSLEATQRTGWDGAQRNLSGSLSRRPTIQSVLADAKQAIEDDEAVAGDDMRTVDAVLALMRRGRGGGDAAEDAPEVSGVMRLQALLRRESLLKEALRNNGDKSFRLLVRSGLLSRPTLRSKAPQWWKPPDVAVEASKAWDRRHRTRAERAEHSFKELNAHTDDTVRQVLFRHHLRNMRQNRYFVPEKAAIVVAPEARQARVALKKA